MALYFVGVGRRGGEEGGWIAIGRLWSGSIPLTPRRGFQTVGQPTFGIDADMGLHTDIPLIAFGGLVYLGVTLSTLVFWWSWGPLMMVASTCVPCFIMMPA